MPHYYVNNLAQPNGDHEVHRDGCDHMPSNRTYLGVHSTCQSAVAVARQSYRTANGCYWCAKACHTQ